MGRLPRLFLLLLLLLLLLHVSGQLLHRRNQLLLLLRFVEKCRRLHHFHHQEGSRRIGQHLGDVGWHGQLCPNSVIFFFMSSINCPSADAASPDDALVLFWSEDDSEAPAGNSNELFGWTTNPAALSCDIPFECRLVVPVAGSPWAPPLIFESLWSRLLTRFAPSLLVATASVAFV